MKPTLLSQLLILNKSILPCPTATEWTTPALRHRESLEKVDCPGWDRPFVDVTPLFGGARGKKERTPGMFAALVCLAIASILGFFTMGIVRVHAVRHEYQVSMQLRHRDRELHQIQRQYHALQAYIAVQSAREVQHIELARASNVGRPLKHSTRG